MQDSNFKNDFSRRLMIAGVLSLVPLRASAQFTLPKEAQDFLGAMQKKNGAAAPANAGAVPGAPAGASLSQGEIGLGLKDALKVASRRVVGQVSKTDGYFGDPAIRIPLPGPLQQVAGPLKAIGASGLMDDLVLRMNRGAEQAAPKALDIFVNAATRMSFDDARGILTGPQDSATQYFRRNTSDSLTTAFKPVIATALTGAGAMGVMKMVQGRAASIPYLGQTISGFDLAAFTVGKALDGLFHYLAVEEGAIRTNPVARSTDLLRKIFG